MNNRICFISPWSYCFFNSDLEFTAGGAQRQIYLLSTHLVEEFDVHVVVGDFGQAKTEQRNGVTLHRAYPKQPRQNILQPVKHTAVLYNALRRADADIYIDRSSPRNTAVNYVLTKLNQGKFVYHVANDANLTTRPLHLPQPVQWTYQKAIRGADAVVAQTGEQQELLSEGYNTKSVHIPNGYPTVNDVNPFDERDFFFWVGRFEREQKRPHIVLDMAERLPEASFKLAGQIDTTKRYSKSIQNRAYKLDNVDLLGSVDPDEIHQLYRRSIALINTSAYEGFPNVFLEAWRQATPVIGLAVDPNRYIDVDFGYARQEPDSLEEQISQLLRDREFREEIGLLSKTEFERHYSIDRLISRYGQLLRSLD